MSASFVHAPFQCTFMYAVVAANVGDITCNEAGSP